MCASVHTDTPGEHALDWRPVIPRQTQLRQRSARKLLVNASSDKTYDDALNFHRRRDFRLVASLPDLYGRGEDMLLVSKDVPEAV